MLNGAVTLDTGSIVDDCSAAGIRAGGDFGSRRFNASGLAPIGGLPEPATWATMIVGLGAVGLQQRRTRRRAVAEPPLRR